MPHRLLTEHHLLLLQIQLIIHVDVDIAHPLISRAAMSCQDDLTSADLTSSVSVQVLERLSAGAGANENLWSFIDHAQ